MPDTAHIPLPPLVRTKIYVGSDMIGSGKIDLLRQIAQDGSITAAAKSMGLSARRAKFLLTTLEACFDAPLVARTPRGSQLTDLGHALIARYDRHIVDVEQASQPFLDWLETHQAKTTP